MIRIKINNFEFLVKSNISVLEACKFVGIDVPRFCYHEMLSVAGNCRMCLVEIEKSPKPVVSCAMPVTNNMQIFVDTPLVKKARENVLETLLLNHPLDCPICDQGGECDLQDQTKIFGGDFSRFFFNKRSVEDKVCGPLIKTIMTRCIHCTRCVRFGSEIAGVEFLGTLNRGGSTEIGSYIKSIFNSEISGNVIDLCPVGALTSKPYAFRARPWEIRSNESIDLTDSTGSNIYVNFKESEVIRILPKNNSEINESIISDKARFSYDSLKNHRLQKIFIKSFVNNVNSYKVSNWIEIFKQVDNLIYNNKTAVLLVDDELDLESLNLLRSLLNVSKNTLKIRIVNSLNSKKPNLFLNSNKNKILDTKSVSKFCFLISTNLRLESSILNTKIRMKYMNNNFKVVGVGQKYTSNFPLEFINLNLIKIISFFEGKNSILSNYFISFKNPIVIFGESFKNRFTNIDNLVCFLKKIMPSAIVLDIKKSCNSMGCELFNIKAVSKNDFLKTDAIIILNLDDNFNIVKLLKNFNRRIFCFTTQKSIIAQKADFIVPVSTYFEEEGIFINFESRPQKTSKTLSVIQDTRSIKNILKTINPKVELKRSLNFFDYIYELIDTPKTFLSIRNKILVNKNLFNFNAFDKSSVSLYPIKSTVENFYTTNKFTKNSSIMIQCSKEIIKNFNNF